MTLRQLRYFLEIAQLRSFTRASEVLHIAQSALSRQVRALEDELGLPLFDRVDRGVKLTAAGERLRDRALVLLSNFDELCDDIVAHAGEPRGPLGIGLPPSLREMVNVPLLGEYAQRYPQVKLHVHEGISIDLEQSILQGRMDCALIVDLETPPTLRIDPVLCEQLFLVGSVAAELDMDRPVSLEHVAGYDLILTSRPNSLRLIVENALARTRRPLRIVADFNATGLMTELVKGGMAYSVLPYSAAWAAYNRGDLTLAPIPDLSIDWVLASRRERPISLAATKLDELILDVARRRIDAGEWIGARITREA